MATDFDESLPQYILNGVQSHRWVKPTSPSDNLNTGLIDGTCSAESCSQGTCSSFYCSQDGCPPTTRPFYALTETGDIYVTTPNGIIYYLESGSDAKEMRVVSPLNKTLSVGTGDNSIDDTESGVSLDTVGNDKACFLINTNVAQKRKILRSEQPRIIPWRPGLDTCVVSIGENAYRTTTTVIGNTNDPGSRPKGSAGNTHGGALTFPYSNGYYCVQTDTNRCVVFYKGVSIYDGEYNGQGIATPFGYGLMKCVSSIGCNPTVNTSDIKWSYSLFPEWDITDDYYVITTPYDRYISTHKVREVHDDQETVVGSNIFKRVEDSEGHFIRFEPYGGYYADDNCEQVYETLEKKEVTIFDAEEKEDGTYETADEVWARNIESGLLTKTSGYFGYLDDAHTVKNWFYTYKKSDGKTYKITLPLFRQKFEEERKYYRKPVRKCGPNQRRFNIYKIDPGAENGIGEYIGYVCVYVRTKDDEDAEKSAIDKSSIFYHEIGETWEQTWEKRINEGRIVLTDVATYSYFYRGQSGKMTKQDWESRHAELLKSGAEIPEESIYHDWDEFLEICVLPSQTTVEQKYVYKDEEGLERVISQDSFKKRWESVDKKLEEEEMEQAGDDEELGSVGIERDERVATGEFHNVVRMKDQSLQEYLTENQRLYRVWWSPKEGGVFGEAYRDELIGVPAYKCSFKALYKSNEDRVYTHKSTKDGAFHGVPPRYYYWYAGSGYSEARESHIKMSRWRIEDCVSCNLDEDPENPCPCLPDPDRPINGYNADNNCRFWNSASHNPNICGKCNYPVDLNGAGIPEPSWKHSTSCAREDASDKTQYKVSHYCVGEVGRVDLDNLGGRIRSIFYDDGTESDWAAITKGENSCRTKKDYSIIGEIRSPEELPGIWDYDKNKTASQQTVDVLGADAVILNAPSDTCDKVEINGKKVCAGDEAVSYTTMFPVGWDYLVRRTISNNVESEGILCFNFSDIKPASMNGWKNWEPGKPFENQDSDYALSDGSDNSEEPDCSCKKSCASFTTLSYDVVRNQVDPGNPDVDPGDSGEFFTGQEGVEVIKRTWCVLNDPEGDGYGGYARVRVGCSSKTVIIERVDDGEVAATAGTGSTTYTWTLSDINNLDENGEQKNGVEYKYKAISTHTHEDGFYADIIAPVAFLKEPDKFTGMESYPPNGIFVKSNRVYGTLGRPFSARYYSWFITISNTARDGYYNFWNSTGERKPKSDEAHVLGARYVEKEIEADECSEEDNSKKKKLSYINFISDELVDGMPLGYRNTTGNDSGFNHCLNELYTDISEITGLVPKNSQTTDFSRIDLIDPKDVTTEFTFSCTDLTGIGANETNKKFVRVDRLTWQDESGNNVAESDLPKWLPDLGSGDQRLNSENRGYEVEGTTTHTVHKTQKIDNLDYTYDYTITTVKSARPSASDNSYDIDFTVKKTGSFSLSIAPPNDGSITKGKYKGAIDEVRYKFFRFYPAYLTRPDYYFKLNDAESVPPTGDRTHTYKELLQQWSQGVDFPGCATDQSTGLPTASPKAKCSKSTVTEKTHYTDSFYDFQNPKYSPVKSKTDNNSSYTKYSAYKHENLKKDRSYTPSSVWRFVGYEHSGNNNEKHNYNGDIEWYAKWQMIDKPTIVVSIPFPKPQGVCFGKTVRHLTKVKLPKAGAWYCTGPAGSEEDAFDNYLGSEMEIFEDGGGEESGDGDEESEDEDSSDNQSSHESDKVTNTYDEFSGIKWIQAVNVWGDPHGVPIRAGSQIGDVYYCRSEAELKKLEESDDGEVKIIKAFEDFVEGSDRYWYWNGYQWVEGDNYYSDIGTERVIFYKDKGTLDVATIPEEGGGEDKDKKQRTVRGQYQVSDDCYSSKAIFIGKANTRACGNVLAVNLNAGENRHMAIFYKEKPVWDRPAHTTNYKTSEGQKMVERMACICNSFILMTHNVGENQQMFRLWSSADENENGYSGVYSYEDVPNIERWEKDHCNGSLAIKRDSEGNLVYPDYLVLHSRSGEILYLFYKNSLLKAYGPGEWYKGLIVENTMNRSGARGRRITAIQTGVNSNYSECSQIEMDFSSIKDNQTCAPCDIWYDGALKKVGENVKVFGDGAAIAIKGGITDIIAPLRCNLNWFAGNLDGNAFVKGNCFAYDYLILIPSGTTFTVPRLAGSFYDEPGVRSGYVSYFEVHKISHTTNYDAFIIVDAEGMEGVEKLSHPDLPALRDASHYLFNHCFCVWKCGQPVKYYNHTSRSISIGELYDLFTDGYTYNNICAHKNRSCDGQPVYTTLVGTMEGAAYYDRILDGGCYTGPHGSMFGHIPNRTDLSHTKPWPGSSYTSAQTSVELHLWEHFKDRSYPAWCELVRNRGGAYECEEEDFTEEDGFKIPKSNSGYTYYKCVSKNAHIDSNGKERRNYKLASEVLETWYFSQYDKDFDHFDFSSDFDGYVISEKTTKKKITLTAYIYTFKEGTWKYVDKFTNWKVQDHQAGNEYALSDPKDDEPWAGLGRAVYKDGQLVYDCDECTTCSDTVIYYDMRRDVLYEVKGSALYKTEITVPLTKSAYRLIVIQAGMSGLLPYSYQDGSCSTFIGEAGGSRASVGAIITGPDDIITVFHTSMCHGWFQRGAVCTYAKGSGSSTRKPPRLLCSDDDWMFPLPRYDPQRRNPACQPSPYGQRNNTASWAVTCSYGITVYMEDGKLKITNEVADFPCRNRTADRTCGSYNIYIDKNESSNGLQRDLYKYSLYYYGKVAISMKSASELGVPAEDGLAFARCCSKDSSYALLNNGQLYYKHHLIGTVSDPKDVSFYCCGDGLLLTKIKRGEGNHQTISQLALIGGFPVQPFSDKYADQTTYNSEEVLSSGEGTVTPDMWKTLKDGEPRYSMTCCGRDYYLLQRGEYTDYKGPTVSYNQKSWKEHRSYPINHYIYEIDTNPKKTFGILENGAEVHLESVQVYEWTDTYYSKKDNGSGELELVVDYMEMFHVEYPLLWASDIVEDLYDQTHRPIVAQDIGTSINLNDTGCFKTEGGLEGVLKFYHDKDYEIVETGTDTAKTHDIKITTGRYVPWKKNRSRAYREAFVFYKRSLISTDPRIKEVVCFRYKNEGNYSIPDYHATAAYSIFYDDPFNDCIERSEFTKNIQEMDGDVRYERHIYTEMPAVQNINGVARVDKGRNAKERILVDTTTPSMVYYYRDKNGDIKEKSPPDCLCTNDEFESSVGTDASTISSSDCFCVGKARATELYPNVCIVVWHGSKCMSRLINSDDPKLDIHKNDRPPVPFWDGTIGEFENENIPSYEKLYPGVDGKSTIITYRNDVIYINDYNAAGRWDRVSGDDPVDEWGMDWMGTTEMAGLGGFWLSAPDYHPERVLRDEDRLDPDGRLIVSGNNTLFIFDKTYGLLAYNILDGKRLKFKR